MCSFWEKIHRFHPQSFTDTGISHVELPFALPALQPQELPSGHSRACGNYLPQMSVCCQFKYHRGFFPQCPFLLSSKTLCWLTKACTEQVPTQSHHSWPAEIGREQFHSHLWALEMFSSSYHLKM